MSGLTTGLEEPLDFEAAHEVAAEIQLVLMSTPKLKLDLSKEDLINLANCFMAYHNIYNVRGGNRNE